MPLEKYYNLQPWKRRGKCNPHPNWSYGKENKKK